jgi:hypothetical protein
MGLVHNRPGQGFPETVVKIIENLLRIDCRFQKATIGIGCDKLNFHGLTAQSDRKGEMGCGDSLLANIGKAFTDTIQTAKKKHAFKPPIREIDNILVFSSRVGQHISKIIVGY